MKNILSAIFLISVLTMCSTGNKKGGNTIGQDNAYDTIHKVLIKDNDMILTDCDENMPDSIEANCWAKLNHSLYTLCNSVIDSIHCNGLHYPYNTNKIPCNSYPYLFYLNCKDNTHTTKDSLRYNWENDTIINICYNDIPWESMIYSTSDTIYTKGNSVTRLNHGRDIGNTLYNKDILNELRACSNDMYRFKNTLNRTYYGQPDSLNPNFGISLMNFYCKIIISKGQIKKHMILSSHITTEQQYARPSRENDGFLPNQIKKPNKRSFVFRY